MHFSLRRKFLLLTALLLAALTVFGTLINVQSQGEAALGRLVEKGHSLASLVARTSANPLVQLDVSSLRMLLAEAAQDDEISYTYLLDADGLVVADGTIANPSRGMVPDRLSQVDISRQTHAFTDALGDLAVAEQVFVGERRIGTVVLGISSELTRQEVARTRNQALLLGLGSIVVGMGAMALLVGGITRPLEDLVRATTRVSAGQLGTRVRLKTGDELEALAESFNQMLTRLEETTVSRDELEARVEERTAELRAANEQLRREISERERAEAEIERLARAPYEATARHLTDGLAIMDPDGRVAFWNPRMEELIEETADDALGRLLLDVNEAAFSRTMDPVAARLDEEKAIRSALNGSPGHLVLELVRPAHRVLDVVLFPIPGPGGLAGFGKLARDVTHEREVDRLKDELVATVSHELRTPLTSLMGFSELLLTREYPRAQRREFLETMLREGKRLTALLDDFLDLQRLQSGMRLMVRRVDLGALLHQAALIANNDPATPLTLDVPPDLPAVYADPERVQQVLANLLSNARKYSPYGGGIRLSASALSGATVEVAVEDHGLGLPTEAIPRLFERFFRVDNSDRREIGGTGLGLAICREIVEAQGGTIEAESAGPGQGSRFRFTLPVATA